MHKFYETNKHKQREMLSHINQISNEANVCHFPIFKHLSPNDANLRDIISFQVSSTQLLQHTPFRKKLSYWAFFSTYWVHNCLKWSYAFFRVITIANNLYFY